LLISGKAEQWAIDETILAMRKRLNILKSKSQWASGSTISNDSVAWQKPMGLVELLGVMGSPFDQRLQYRPQA